MRLIQQNHINGFTLIELMIVMAIVAILLAVAAPGFGNLQNETYLRINRDKLLEDIRLTRAEAMKRRVSPVFCKSSDGVSCGTAAVKWNDGWIGFVDDGIGTGGIAGDSIINGDEYVIVKQTALPHGVTITTTASAIAYNAQGFIPVPGATFYFCKSGFNKNKQVVLNAVGRPAIVNSDTATGC